MTAKFCRRNSIKIAARLGAALAAATLVHGAEAQPPKTAQTRPDTIEALQKLLPENVKLLTVTHALMDGVGPYLRLDGVITVDDPGPAEVRFMAALPPQFNGRYFMISQGGTGGQVPDPDKILLSEGYALASSDRGTRPVMAVDTSVYSDPVQGLNLAHRAMHVTAVATQQLTRAYYGVSSLYRYTGGCSGGGLAGWNNMRTYGAADFDGVIIGNSAPIGPTNPLGWARFYQHLLKQPDGWISPELIAAAEKAIMKKYDGVDGALDGIIQDGRRIDWDEGLLRDVGFSEAQIESFNFLRASWKYLLTNPPTTIGGATITRLSDWTSWFFGTKPPPWPAYDTPGAPRAYQSTRVFFDGLPGKENLLEINLDAPAAQALFARPDGSSNAPFDFRKFRDGGGKAVLYYGVDDPILGFAQQGVLGLEGARALERRPQNLDKWMRLFSVPGMLHCRGGAGPDDVLHQALKATVEWVEKGVVPDAIVAHRDRGVERSFLLCPEPKRAAFKGGAENPASLDVNDASNWACVGPGSKN